MSKSPRVPEPGTPRFHALGRFDLQPANCTRRRSLELLLLLTLRPEGWYPDGLSEALYGSLEPQRLKPEISRLRNVLGLAVSRPPYRLETPLWADYLELETALARGMLQKALQLYRGPLAPGSEAPGVVEHRRYLEALLKDTLLRTHQAPLLLALVERFPEDLELLEAVRERLPDVHPARPYLEGRIAALRAEYEPTALMQPPATPGNRKSAP